VLSAQAITAPDAWARLLKGHTAVRRELSVQLDAEHGLTLNDYEALLLLSRAEEGRMRRVDLAEKLMLSASGVTRLLDGLENEGLVERAACDSDRRVVYAVITEAGHEKLRAAGESHIASIRALFEARFDEQELAHLAELLGRLPGAADASGEECTA
jgi:DNA-binding MarR family transcriptional regulator